MNLPEKIKVGFVEYKVIAQGTLFPGRNEATSGYIDAGKLEIYVRTDMPHQSQCATLMHEIMHAIDWDLCPRILANPDQDIDYENKIDNISRGWLQVLKDNPELIKFIQGE